MKLGKKGEGGDRERERETGGEREGEKMRFKLVRFTSFNPVRG